MSKDVDEDCIWSFKLQLQRPPSSKESIMLVLASLPSELIAEVATHLQYEEAQNLRLVCRRIDRAIQHIALARLKIEFIQTYGRNYYRSRIPFEKFTAYTIPGHSAGFNFVRHLTIDRICIDLHGNKPPLAPVKVDPHISKEDSPFEVDYRFQALKKLFENLLLGDGLKSLESITWNVRKCCIHSSEPGYCHPEAEEPENECQNILEMFAALLISRGPLRRLEIIVEEESTLTSHPNGLPGIPPCKEFMLEGISDMPLSGTDVVDYVWVDKIIADCPGLETFDTDWRFSEGRFALHFPATTSPDSSAGRIKYPSLFLQPGAYQIPNHAINHFRHLKKLDIGSPDLGDVNVHSGVASLWSLLAAEHIYAEDICLFLGVAQSGLVDYLASYPQPSLKRLDLWTYHDEDTECLPNVAQDFFSRGFPVIASGLERFSIDTFHLNEWCIKPEIFLALKECVSLKEVSVSMETAYTGEGFKDMVYNTFTRYHRQIESVSIVDIFNTSEVMPGLRYKQYSLEFAGPCLKVLWGSVCNLHRNRS